MFIYMSPTQISVVMTMTRNGFTPDWRLMSVLKKHSPLVDLLYIRRNLREKKLLTYIEYISLQVVITLS